MYACPNSAIAPWYENRQEKRKDHETGKIAEFPSDNAWQKPRSFEHKIVYDEDDEHEPPKRVANRIDRIE